MRKGIIALIIGVVIIVTAAYGAEVFRGKIAIDGTNAELTRYAQNGFLTKPGGSTGIWQNFPNMYFGNPVAYGVFEDFMAQAAVDSLYLTTPTGWYASGDTTVATTLGMLPVADTYGGVGRLTINKHLANSGEIVKMTNIFSASSEPFKIVSNSGKKLWFAARVRFPAAVDSCSFAFGLTRKTATWDSIFTDTTGEIYSTGLMFNVTMTTPGSSPDSVKFTEATNGSKDWQYAQKVTANVWYTFGFYFNGADKVYPYVNDTLKTPIDTDDATFPDENLTLFIGGKKLGLDVFGTEVRHLDVDWIKCVQLR